MYDRHATLGLLRRGAHALSQEIAQCPAEAVLWRPAAGEWSVHEALTHLRDVERHVFRWRLERVCEAERPALPYFDEAAYHRDHWDSAIPLAQLLADWLADRAAEVARLEQAPDWGRVGLHETRGPVTLAWLAEYAVFHTWEHLSQIGRVRLAWEVRRD